MPLPRAALSDFDALLDARNSCRNFDTTRALPLAQFWLHGHLHCQQDYVEHGCRVLANTLGYAAKGEQEGFRPHFVVEVPPPPSAC